MFNSGFTGLPPFLLKLYTTLTTEVWRSAEKQAPTVLQKNGWRTIRTKTKRSQNGNRDLGQAAEDL